MIFHLCCVSFSQPYLVRQFYLQGCENCTALGLGDQEDQDKQLRGHKENVQDSTTQNFNGYGLWLASVLAASLSPRLYCCCRRLMPATALPG